MIFQIFVVCAIFQQAFGHGWMREPVSRSSAWRLGFPTPMNVNDDNLSCGGYLAMMSYGGKCGICGDPWVSENAIRDNEAGGKYATGTIVKSYTMGETINIKINLIANHGGWMEFRICPNNDVRKRVTKECLERHVLQRADGTGTKTIINDRRTGVWTMAYKLPENMVCSQCIIQWKYHTGSSYGMDKDTGKYCIGCGDQEEFYGCADVAIVGSTGMKMSCKGIHNWANDPNLDKWCTDNCAIGNCPVYACDCSGSQQLVTDKPTTTQRPTTPNPSTTSTTPTTTSTTPTTKTTTPTTTTTTPKPTTSTGPLITDKPTTTQRPTTPKPTTTSTTSTTTSTTPSTTTTTPTTTSTTPTTTTTTLTTTTTTPIPNTSSGPLITEKGSTGMKMSCKGILNSANKPNLDKWCTDNCAIGNCPVYACDCSGSQQLVTDKPTTTQRPSTPNPTTTSTTPTTTSTTPTTKTTTPTTTTTTPRPTTSTGPLIKDKPTTTQRPTTPKPTTTSTTSTTTSTTPSTTTTTPTTTSTTPTTTTTTLTTTTTTPIPNTSSGPLITEKMLVLSFIIISMALTALAIGERL